MPSPERLQRGSLSMGDALGSSFSIWGANALPFILITLLVYLPGLVAELIMGAPPVVDPNENPFGVMFEPTNIVRTILDFLLQPLATAFIVFAVFQQLRGNKVSFGEMLSVGVNRMLMVLVVGLLVGLIIGIGTLFCIIPGIILTCVLYVTIPAAVVEGTGVAGSMNRSAALTRGHRGTIFAIALVFGLILIAVGFSVGLALGTADYTINTIVMYVLTSFLASINSVIACVVYHQLRKSKEGIDVDELVKAFE